jgi:hypothetical protein
MIQQRDLTLTLEPVMGSITLFYAFIEGDSVIKADGTKKRTWTGKISMDPVKLLVRVIGIGDASFKLGIDLPGTVNYPSQTLQLKGGAYEKVFSL